MTSTSFSVELMNHTLAVPKVSDIEYTAALIVFSFLAILGILGSATMIAIMLYMERTAFHVILIGMCVSDILSACNSPLYVLVQMHSANFTLPAFLCPLTITLDHSTTFGTLSHVLLLSYMRFQTIVVDHVIVHRDSEDVANQYVVIVALSWLLSALISIPLPFAITSAVTPEGVVCGGKRDAHIATRFMAAVSITVGIIVPIVMIVVLCSRMILLLKNIKSPSSNRASAKRKQRNAVNQLLAIVVTVLFGYCCDYGNKFYFMFRWKETADREKILAALAAHCVLRITGCVNPLIYYLGSNELQEAAASWFISEMKRNAVRPDFHVMKSTKIEVITVK